MATRTLAASDEVILPGETEVIHPLPNHLRVFLPKIGDGTGQTVVAGTQILFATEDDGRLEILRNGGHRLELMPARSARIALAETVGQWSIQEAPPSYPYARVTDGPEGGGGPHTHPISDVVDLQDELDAKADIGHAHSISDTTGLQTTLDAKAASSHNHNASDINAGTLAEARLPVATTAARGALRADHNEAGNPAALTASGHGAAADPHPQYALDSEKGAVSGIATLDGAGKLTAAQLPLGTSATTAAAGNDSRLSDSRTPLSHATSHQSGGGDAIKLDDLATPDDNTDLNASTTRHGLLLKLNNNASQFLNGQGAWAAPGGGSDPWTIVVLGSDFPTSSASAVDVTGLGFTPVANTRYMIEGILFLRTATATVNPRTGFAWPTGMTDGVMSIDEAQSASAQLMARGNINASLLVAVGGIPNTTQSWPAFLYGAALAGASPSGNLRVQIASETAGTTVTVKAGSFIRYRTY